MDTPPLIRSGVCLYSTKGVLYNTVGRIIYVACNLKRHDSNHNGLISHHITPLVIYCLRGETHTHIHTYIHTCTHTHTHTHTHILHITKQYQEARLKIA